MKPLSHQCRKLAASMRLLARRLHAAADGNPAMQEKAKELFSAADLAATWVEPLEMVEAYRERKGGGK